MTTIAQREHMKRQLDLMKAKKISSLTRQIYHTDEDKIEFIRNGKAKLKECLNKNGGTFDRWGYLLESFYYPGGLTPKERAIQKRKFEDELKVLSDQYDKLLDAIHLQKDHNSIMEMIRGW